MIKQRPLTEDEKSELARLNAGVTAAIEARRDWLDAKMHECSCLQVGDDIYDARLGARLGRVTGLYRFWRDRDDGIRDKSVECEYQYETRPGSFDNTSSQSRSFGTREDALRYAEMRASQLRVGTNNP